MQASLSLMCMDLNNVEKQINLLNDFADFYHVDIMDGHYVKNIVLSPDFIKSIKKIVKKPIDAHLMVTNPENYIDELLKNGTDIFDMHADTLHGQAFRLINKIKEKGRQVGIVLNPEDNITMIMPYIEKIDVITIMTVDPGFAGQKFIKESVEKIKSLDKLRTDKKLCFRIQVDGSCNENTVGVLSNAGTDTMILGSSGFFGYSDDISACIKYAREYLG
ncbi:D-allulose 6-phosphate 3-epimerase [Lactobacillus sp. ESL0791]|uniref:D-allulose 6-phosphate 3-epimerase n=1 Tax=Lactobacillus sp. ESL0791 TaxID=2983234 RepID=UPI0023F7ABF5|nr:D-allulose 6-phosphate 3-epimerase [Lactobacillus sp. ESL0791]MDF7639461.1 D-allulose 6-phosphate 3-epimerase [Lactobacillus sp. ESL0791]